MPASVEKPDDRNIQKLLEGLKNSIKQAKESEGTSNVEELKQKIQNKREH